METARVVPLFAQESDFAARVQQAWGGKLPVAELFAYASQLETGRRPELAAVLYRTWLDRNDTPQNHFVWFNLGVASLNAGDAPGAREAYEKAISLSPGFIQAHFNLGLAQERLNNPAAAIAEWSWIVANTSVGPDDQRQFRLMALNNLGRLHENARRYPEALACLNASLAIDPKQPDVLHHWVFIRARLCEWPVYAPLPGVDLALARESTSVMAMTALSDDPEAQLAAARNFVKHKIKCDLPQLTAHRNYGHRKIRIGYLSSDLCLHPVAMLTAELFELHDRNAFEVYGYCWSREDGSALRQRVIQAMDHFERIGSLDDEAAARLIRSHEIDVLVDLQGQTLGARPHILARRPAPIQITYLGLPATTGLPFIDYVIADRFLIPQDCARFYSEKPLYLPDVYQVSDRKRLASATPSREALGLPRDAFVFCCFNNNYKYTPEVFGAWMRILERTPGSVLWLLADNPGAQANLRKEAQRHGLDERRLVFASRAAPHDYLARYGTADLFLDTFPFNAGTTANDALWMGLPVLTLTGRTFASRMAGALLTAAGLDELVTCNLRDYEEKAVALAHSGECARLRERLAKVKHSGVLFDTPRFVRNFERALQELVQALP